MLMRVPMYRLTQLPIKPMENEPMKRNTCASMMLMIRPMSRIPMPSSTRACVRKGVMSERTMPASMPKDICAISHLNGHTYFRAKRTKLCFSLTAFFS